MERYLRKIDKALIPVMKRLGHRTERYLLAIVFIWFGLLKILGETSASSIIAKSIYWFEPEIIIPILGVWEIFMGASLLFNFTLRFAILLLFIRLPGTLLAFHYHFYECFSGSIFLPTIQGQYLIKELTLVGAALVIGSSKKMEYLDKN